ncbi:tail assembly protein [Escherichia coli TW09109]|nr:tail assembly protein [Escherichia coli TW09109]
MNISGEPEAYFRMSPEDWLQAEMQGEIVALVHSHPGGLPWLSEADRRLQVQSDLPWWLVVAGGRFISSAVCRISPGGALSTG